MKSISKLFGSFLLAACALSVAVAATTPAAAPAKKKNWTAPAQKIYAQELADKVLQDHPELISVTLQGNPPGAAKDVYSVCPPIGDVKPNHFCTSAAMDAFLIYLRAPTA